MDDSTSPAGRPLVVGANHQSSPLSLRDRIFVEDPMVPSFLHRLREQGLTQAMILSTCDRVEIQAVHPNRDVAVRAIVRVLAEHGGLDDDELDVHLYQLCDKSAVRHIFAVTASLASQVIGEPQVFGQVKASHRLTREAGMSGSELEALLQAAYTVAKRVRTETAIGERPVSIAAAAVQLARDLHGDLGTCSGLLLGAGEMGSLIAEDMVSAGLGDLTILHPSPTRAEALARSLGCHTAPYEDMPRLLNDADIVLSAKGARRYTLTADRVTAALRVRRRRPIFIVDAVLPGDVEPAVNRINEAFLYDLDDLERIAMEGRANREAEARAAWGIIDAEVADFLHGRAERAAVPALTWLRRHFEAIREETLEDAGDDAERATRLLINRLLHGPSRAMRQIAAGGDTSSADGESESDTNLSLEQAEHTLARLFGVDDDDRDDAFEAPDDERGHEP